MSVEKRVICNTQTYNHPALIYRKSAVPVYKLNWNLPTNQTISNSGTTCKIRYSFQLNKIITKMDLTLQLWQLCSTISGSNGGLFSLALIYPLFQYIIMLNNFLYFKIYFYFFLYSWKFRMCIFEIFYFFSKLKTYFLV